MLNKLKQSWRHLKEGKPGQRFESEYRRRKQSRQSPFSRIIFVVIGLLLIAAGIFFLPAPGPGTLILALGGGLIARESLIAARVLDWLEIKIRRVLASALKLWAKSPLRIKVLIVVLALIVLAALAFVAYKIAF
ncbi:MAG TPA: PGPGW domain-containing protein [Blastocatellia bacterium]|nr:PGPGW domain-containing protein [Blastocatellia bacterium]